MLFKMIIQKASLFNVSKDVLYTDVMGITTPFPAQMLTVSTVTKRRAPVRCVDLVTKVRSVS